jgi:hypothetical protein
MTSADINKKLNSLNTLIQEFGISQFSSRDIWNRKKEIDENLKATQFDSAEDKATTLAAFEQLVKTITEKEAAVEAANEQFTQQGEQMVAQLAVAANNVLAQNTITKDDFKNLREIANQTFECFKQKRWTTKDRRTAAWDTYNHIRSIVKDKEDELFAQERATREKQQSQSLAITEKLCVIVNACAPAIAIEELQAFVERFQAFLHEQDLVTTDAKPWHLIAKPEESKYSLRSRTETLNDVRNFIGIYKDVLTREHKGQVFANIDAIKEDLNKAWEEHKEAQQKRQEEWEIKKKERDEKREEWTKKQREFLDMLEKRLVNQQAYKAKQESYLQNQQVFEQRFQDRIAQQKDYSARLKDQLKDLNEKLETAWTDSFKTKVAAWIAEKEEKLVSVEKDIEVLKNKLEDIAKNTESLPLKIADLDASIAEIESKIAEVKEKLANDVVVEKS